MLYIKRQRFLIGAILAANIACEASFEPKTVDETDTCYIIQQNDGHFCLIGRSHLVKNEVYLKCDNDVNSLAIEAKKTECRLLTWKWTTTDLPKN